MHDGSSVGKTRFWLYWGTGIGTTCLFLFSMASMLMVPGVLA